MRPQAIPPCRRWCSCTASAARRGHGAANWIFRGSLRTDRLGHAGLWRFGAAAHRQHRDAGRCAEGFPAAGGRDRPVLVGHSIGGMIVQQLLAKNPASLARWCWRRPVRHSASPMATGRKQFIDARLGPLDRGETMVSLAPSLVKNDRRRPGSAGMELARDCMAERAGGDLSRHHAGTDGFDLRAR